MIIAKSDIDSKIINKIKKGAIFIYPTDTIYGIGCIATNHKSVEKIRSIKVRDEKPFSIIAPSKTWIRETCYVKHFEDWIKKLPGKYTLILEIKNKKSFSEAVNKNLDTAGIRIPNHWIKNLVRKIGKPLITTSVNLSGEKHIMSIDQIPKSISEKVDFIIDEGILNGKPSTIVLKDNEKIKLIKR